MEKISRILPPSRRVVATDTESSQPVRPGAPEFGRPMQKPLDVQDRLNFSSLAASRPTEQAPVTYKNTKEGARARAVEDLAEKFFNPRSVAKEGEGPQSEEILKRMEQNQAFSKVTPVKGELIPKEIKDVD
ncbi:hypothetical protein [Bdellovibrio sp. HCB337]|uniref:hypothetical protein n=1 Tax=Bdellovibrio sp. HCB337 TaxID=3394358 RepID=UPI0039A5CA8F